LVNALPSISRHREARRGRPEELWLRAIVLEVAAKATKVMISMPEDLLERVDRAAGERGTSRSAFLQEAARRELGWPDPATVDAALERGRNALARAGAFESAELVRAERDARDRRR